MAVDPREIRSLIETKFPDAKVEVIDMVGDGDHLQATVITSAFSGKPLLAQHKMVFEALGDMMKAQLHALKLKTYSPEQWEKLGVR